MTEPAAETPAGPPKRSLAHRLAIRLAEAVGALVGLALLGVAVLAIRLQLGPIAVDWLTPALTTLLNDEADPLRVAVAETSISWTAGHENVGLFASGIRLSDRNGVEIARIPRLSVALSLRFLLRGKLAPARVTVIDPVIRIQRDVAGGVALDTVPGNTQAGGPAASAAAAPAISWPAILRSLGSDFESPDPLSALRSLTIRGLAATIEDAQSGLTFTLAGGEVDIARGLGGIETRIGGDLAAGPRHTRFSASADLDRATQILRVVTDIDAVDPADYAAALSGDAARLGDIRLPIGGRIAFSARFPGIEPLAAAIQLHAGSGSLHDAHFAGGVLELAEASLAASYDFGTGRLDGLRLWADLGGPVVTADLDATGLVPRLLSGEPGDPPAKLIGQATLRNLPIDRFAHFWPAELAPNPRRWILDNLSAGTVESAKIAGSTDFAPGNAKLPPPAFTAGMVLTNATVTYVDGLPKVQHVDATVSAVPGEVDFKLGTGKMLGLAMTGGTISIAEFDAPHELISIDLGIAGPARDVMTVLDTPPLHYAKAVGIDPATVGGTVDGRLQFRFRLIKDLPFSAVEYGAQARLQPLSIAGIVFHRDLTEGNFALALDTRKVTLEGDGKLDGVPVTLSWMQRLGDQPGPDSEVHAQARLDQHARQRFGIDPIPDYLTGPVDARVVYAVADKHRATAKVEADLADARISLDAADWTKPPGTPGTADFVLDLQDGAITRMRDLSVQAADLALKGTLDFRAGSLIKAVLPQVRLGRTDLTATLDHGAGDPWRLTLHGGVLDATPLMKRLAKDKSAAAPDADPGPAMAIDLQSDEVILGPDREMRKVTLAAAIARHRLEAATLHAAIGEAGKLDFRLDRPADGGAIALETDDFGAFFRLGGITTDVVGGTLALDGIAREDGAARRFTAHAEGRDYRLIHASFMARLLSLASFQGVGALLSGSGIPFGVMKADLTLKQGRLDLTHGLAYGGAIGLTADGWFDLNGGTLSLDGTLVPAYTLNSALGGLPVIGNLLLGGEGQGLFGANISVTGPIAEPKIGLNPLSAFAPGLLRKLFLFDAPGGDAPPPEPAKP